ncbi:AAA family ATPase [Candidatus Micrarchaeota archaeon]|nr:AAA family ATPase [Candidatus Micrarchaeota archaeon]
MDDIFEKEMQKSTVFTDRNVLSAHYVPDVLPHREKEIEKIMKTLAPALKGTNYSNLFIYGKTGTGKTATTRHVLDRLMQVKEKYNANVDAIYVNCRISNTKYQVVLKFAEHCVPNENFLGYPLQHLLDKTMKTISENNTNVVIVLDELDKVKSLDDLMYTLTRANDELKKGHIGLIGITNNVLFKKELDPRSKSTLCEDEMVFAPYNAEQLREILKQRADMGYRKNAIGDAAIDYAAALSAQESGDARYALKLLLKAGEIADGDKAGKITEDHIKRARKGVEEEIVLDLINTLPKQQQIVLYAIAALTSEAGKYQRLDGSHDEKILFSGEVFEKYERLCHTFGQESRSARWCREYINDLEMLGLITTTQSGKGYRGNTTLIRLAFAADKIKKAVESKIGA